MTREELDHVKKYFRAENSGDELWRFHLGWKKWVKVKKTIQGSTGYLLVKLPQSRAMYRRHRLIYELITDTPLASDEQIDHIDGDPVNNHIDNLRVVSVRDNMSNTYRHREGKLVGASFDKQKKKWVALINDFAFGKIYRRARIYTSNTGYSCRRSEHYASVQCHLGRFDTEEEAHEHYLIAKELLHLATPNRKAFRNLVKKTYAERRTNNE